MRYKTSRNESVAKEVSPMKDHRANETSYYINIEKEDELSRLEILSMWSEKQHCTIFATCSKCQEGAFVRKVLVFFEADYHGNV